MICECSWKKTQIEKKYYEKGFYTTKMADQELIKKNQFKSRNVETFYRRLIRTIQEILIEGSYENHCFHRKQTRTN